MSFLKFFEEKSRRKEWLNLLLNLVDFLSKEELMWIPDNDDKIKDSFSVLLQEEGINGGLKIRISMVKGDEGDMEFALTVEHHENFCPIAVMVSMEEGKTELYGFCKCDKNIGVTFFGEEDKLVKAKFKELHEKLTCLRLSKSV